MLSGERTPPRSDVIPDIDERLAERRELVGVVERHVLSQAALFVGCALSSMSHYVKERVLLRRSVALDYMAPPQCQVRRTRPAV